MATERERKAAVAKASRMVRSEVGVPVRRAAARGDLLAELLTRDEANTLVAVLRAAEGTVAVADVPAFASGVAKLVRLSSTTKEQGGA